MLYLYLAGNAFACSHGDHFLVLTIRNARRDIWQDEYFIIIIDMYRKAGETSVSCVRFLARNRASQVSCILP
jgi:hypothetical protein